MLVISIAQIKTERVTYLKRIATSTPKVAIAPKKFQIAPKIIEPNLLTIIISRKIPNTSKKMANIIKQMAIIDMTARILKIPVCTET